MAALIGNNLGFMALTFLPPILWLIFYLREDRHPIFNRKSLNGIINADKVYEYATRHYADYIMAGTDYSRSMKHLVRGDVKERFRIAFKSSNGKEMLVKVVK